MMFMVTFEIPVVATSIIAITDDLGGADNSSWLLTSYLLGYVGKPPNPREHVDTISLKISKLSLSYPPN